MTDDKIPRLSRRRVLGTLGALGAGAALGGAGTTAFFSDKETFTDNTLTAGELDLKVDWEEHYHLTKEQVFLEGDDGEFPGIVREDPQDPNFVGFPDPLNPMVWVHVDALEEYMEMTAIEAFPDPDNDGMPELEFEGWVYDPCEHGADTPEDLDPSGEMALRTENQDTWDGEEPKPLVALEDLKPGDFGEVTFSFHNCDNPGYVWMFADNVAWAENGFTEPELKDEDEDGPEGDNVELDQAIQTIWWYDTDGDNVFDQAAEAEPACVHLVLDSSGSMTSTDGDLTTRQEEMQTGAKQLAQAILDASDQNTVGVTEFNGDANTLQGQTDNYGLVETAIDSVDADGSTSIDAGINAGDAALAECPEDTRHIMIVVTDGENNAGSGPVQTASDNAIASNTDEIYAVGTGGATQASLEAIANPDDEAHISLTTDLTQAIADLVEVLIGEELIFRGSLRDSLNALMSDNGIPLDGNRQTAYDEVGAIGDETNPEYGERECFPASDTQYIGFAWWLPVDHANEIQTDSVVFDIGFYTEQCRHNDGEGMPFEPTTTTEEPPA